MALENAEFIHQLVPSNPPGTDFVLEGDNHVRMLKDVLQKQFPEAIVAGILNAIEVAPTNDPTSGDELLWSPLAIQEFIKEHWSSWGITPAAGEACFSVHKDGTGQTLTDGTIAKITWSAKDFDDGDRIDFTNNRHTPGAAALGRWRYSATLGFDFDAAGSSGGECYCELRHFSGAGALISSKRLQNSVRGSDDISVTASAIIEIGAADEYVEVYGELDRVTDQVIGDKSLTWFEGAYIGAAPAP